ncbi:MAG: hypothetical protein ACTHOU_08115, partial [Aureliella sp.]
MLNFSQLSKKRQARFLLQLVELLETYKKRSSDFFRYSFASPAITAGPSLYLMPNEILWEFEFADRADGDPQRAELKLRVDRLWDERSDENADVNTLLKKRLITSFEYQCTCQGRAALYSVPLMCPHTAAAIEFVRKRVERATTDEALSWLDQCIAQPENIGRSLVETLEQSREQDAQKPASGDDDVRIVWRLSGRGSAGDNPLELEMVVQRPKGRGGWTVGKRVRDPMENLPEQALKNTHDRMLALICDSYFGHYASYPEPAVLIQILEVLRECPHVVWNAPGNPPARIHRGEVAVRLVEDDDAYTPEILLDGQPLELSATVELGKDRFGGIFVDDREHSVVYFTLSAEQSQLVKMMVRASARGARLDREAAERFSKAMSTGTPQKKLALQIPESLAGPDVLLQPTVELHLEPKERHQLEARLRVACTELDDSPIPGLGLERTLVHTAAGVYHIVRDLAAEAAAAERVADQLGLGDFMF